MKNVKFILAAACLSATAAVSAQVNQTPMTGGGRQILNINEKPATISGSMYVNEAFLPAKISDNSTTVLLRYNAYSDYFEMNNPQEQVTKALPKQTGVKVTFAANGQEYEDVTYEKSSKQNTGYLAVLAETPKVKIFKRERVYLQEATKSDNGYQAAKPATYKKAADEFYAQVNGGEIQYYSSKKALGKLFGDKSKAVLDYIKKNDIDVEKTEDVQKLADYASTL